MPETTAGVYPLAFSVAQPSAETDVYLREPLARKLAEFFEDKGLAALKDEDRREQWYDDWLEYQAEHQLYARLLSPREHSSLGSEFDLLRYARFLEVCAYFSPAHGYSLQASFLGLGAIMMGVNTSVKGEAVAALEAGGQLAFGISERAHGSDLLANEFTVADGASGRLVASGEKFYIGNSNCATIISILAQREGRRDGGHGRRRPFVLFALRPDRSTGFRHGPKIRTLGIRSAHVGEFEVTDHEMSEEDVCADGRAAWDAVFGTVTLGKFFLGFGSIGICEHAFQEAMTHLRTRVLYGSPAIDMPHIQATMAQAYVRLIAMKLYAYRTLDFVHAACADDRRYLLFTAVQKARVTTEGVKVLALLSECIGARGFESDTHFEMALRDVQLVPGLESSTHINLGLTAQFAPRYLADGEAPGEPGSLVAGEIASVENAYLLRARTGAISAIRFPPLLQAYRPLMSIANVRRFVKAAKAFQLLARGRGRRRTTRADNPATLGLGQCLATLVYAQLVAENAVRLNVPAPIVAAIFQTLVHDFSIAALTLASCRESAGPGEPLAAGAVDPRILHRLVSVARLSADEAEFVSKHMAEIGDSEGRSE
ncbi:MAG: acyl-CoA/acyl-ACP dehydrogenase [Planctomycetes bacterium]|nr:acyl-CoA/acyl-ACP dehydrogenase [Planctomycetota bacterium]